MTRRSIRAGFLRFAVAARLLSLVVLLALLLSGCGGGREPGLRTQAASSPSRFLRDYWARPLAAQGSPPSAYSPLEASLDPRSCGACHVAQYRDWATSRHAHAFGPGLLGQMQALAPTDHAGHQDCLRCHAPLAEQERSLSGALQWWRALPGSNRVRGVSWRDGLSCAACHVRGNRRFGPPARPGTGGWRVDPQPHGGWTASPAFESSRFCAACHQFPSSIPALNGKELENTYVEWRSSRYATEGITCQTCHMPQRRHLWRGIHDPAMVRSGIAIDADPPRIAVGEVRAMLRLVNRRVGHDFPTYVTPRVILAIAQVSAGGGAIAGTVQRGVIARDVSLDLQRERFDTRVPPGGHFTLRYRVPKRPGAAGLRYTIVVEPDHFYARFYRATVDDPSFHHGRATLRAALREAEASRYTLLDFSLSFPASGRRTIRPATARAQ